MTRYAKKLITVQARKGSLVCWDNRLPHATCAQLSGADSREVVFVGFLPDVELNRKYMAQQLLCMMKSLTPPAYDSLPTKPPDFSLNDLSPRQQRLLCFSPH